MAGANSPRPLAPDNGKTSDTYHGGTAMKYLTLIKPSAEAFPVRLVEDL